MVLEKIKSGITRGRMDRKIKREINNLKRANAEQLAYEKSVRGWNTAQIAADSMRERDNEIELLKTERKRIGAASANRVSRISEIARRMSGKSKSKK